MAGAPPPNNFYPGAGAFPGAPQFPGEQVLAALRQLQ